ncbi:uncharacterized protein LOC110866483 [Helianthus annuus]|uniref:uncharacterized protein LOC110866483 n=1 Tax=Helianthus annuus TaxID=4232 RepID=UPI000B8F3F0D|nr:uncharacterized protein LOC110866483 [Helianthus annuus]
MPAVAAEHSKFIRTIALAPLEKANLPQTVGTFNGLTDPDDHVQLFTSVGVVGRWTMPMWCHLFIQNLMGAARAWFDSLPTGRIKSWVNFQEQFLAHFSQQRRYKRDTSEVMDIWRRENEGLEDFITRFNKECLEIGRVSEDLVRAHFKKAIRCDSLIWSITGKDEGRYSRNNARESNRRKNNKNPGWKSNQSSGYDERPRFKEDTCDTIDQIGYRKVVKNENREKHWTLLIKTPNEVLMTKNHDFKAPKPMLNKKGQDPNLYCDFHKDTGHLTDDCICLRQEIEKALKSGKLSHLLKNVRKETRQIQRNDEGGQKKVRRLETHMVDEPRKSMKSKGKRPFEPAWQEQQVIFQVVRRGPAPHAPSSSLAS